MKIKINEDNCIGCGYCEGVCEEVFEVMDGVSHVKSETIDKDYEEQVIEAIEGCPTSAIEEEK